MSSLARPAARIVTFVLACLAVAYVGAVATWLWSLRDSITGPRVSTGVMLVGVAVLLAWLAAIAGAGWAPTAHIPAPQRTDWHAGVATATGRPLAILRIGLAVQLGGFSILVAFR